MRKGMWELPDSCLFGTDDILLTSPLPLASNTFMLLAVHCTKTCRIKDYIFSFQSIIK